MCVTRPGLLLLLTLFGSVAWAATYQEERRIFGKVTDESGRPVKNAQVILEYAPFGVIRKPFWSEMSKTTTSETGEYKFSSDTLESALPHGAYRLTFKYRGYGQVSRTTHIGLNVSGPNGVPAFEQEVDVQLPKNPSVAIRAKPRRRPVYPDGPGPPARSYPVATPSPSATPEPSIAPTSPPAMAPPVGAPRWSIGPGLPSSSSNTTSSAKADIERPEESPNSPEIDRIISTLGVAKIAFNTPDSMSLNEAKKLELLFSTYLSEEELKKAVAEHNVEGTIQGEPDIKFSDEMEATLTGDGFQITNVLPARRLISKKKITEWTWDVRPLKEGKLRLHLTLNALVKIGGDPQLYPIRTYDREYTVSVGFTDSVTNFAKDHWQWLWTTVFLPVGAWLWKRKRKDTEAKA
jgi:hypothetical protein